jgi:hypothetical protein
MRFQETIGQHFRRALVSKRFRSCKRGSPHVMGTGAIVTRSIACASTEIDVSGSALVCEPRRRARCQVHDARAAPSSAKKNATGGTANRLERVAPSVALSSSPTLTPPGGNVMQSALFRVRRARQPGGPS